MSNDDGKHDVRSKWRSGSTCTFSSGSFFALIRLSEDPRRKFGVLVFSVGRRLGPSWCVAMGCST